MANFSKMNRSPLLLAQFSHQKALFQQHLSGKSPLKPRESVGREAYVGVFPGEDSKRKTSAAFLAVVRCIVNLVRLGNNTHETSHENMENELEMSMYSPNEFSKSAQHFSCL